MPMSGSNYVAPTWVDNAPPALDATELQAMCDTIAENQSDAAALQEAVSALQSAVSSLTTSVNSRVKAISGTYVGTGTSTVSISGLSDPQYLFVYGVVSEQSAFIPCWSNEASAGIGAGLYTYSGNQSSYSAYLVSTYGSSVSFSSYSGNSNGLNSKGITYYYLAFSL